MIKVYSAECCKFLRDYDYCCALGIRFGKYTDRRQCCLKDVSKASKYERGTVYNTRIIRNMYVANECDANGFDMVQVINQ